MNKYRKFLSFLLIPLLLSSCFFKIYKPYGIKILTNLKTSEESEIFKDYACEFAITSQENIFYVIMEYNSKNKKILVSQITSNLKKSSTGMSSATSFMNKYFFLTKDTIEEKLPPNLVNASYSSKRKTVYFSRKISNEKDNTEIHYYRYGYFDGFLLLLNYEEKKNGKIIEGRIRFETN